MLDFPAELAGEPRLLTKLLLHQPEDATGGVSGIFATEPRTVHSPLATLEISTSCRAASASTPTPKKR